MGYNIIDILDKAKNISVRKKSIYESIGKENSDIHSIKIVTKVLQKQASKAIEYYEALKNLAGEEVEEIDFVIYDKISFLLNGFSEQLHSEKVSNVHEYLEFSLGLERDSYSLLIDIQGRFVKESDDIHTKTYEILSKMIKNKQREIQVLEETLKRANKKSLLQK